MQITNSITKHIETRICIDCGVFVKSIRNSGVYCTAEARAREKIPAINKKGFFSIELFFE